MATAIKTAVTTFGLNQDDIEHAIRSKNDVLAGFINASGYEYLDVEISVTAAPGGQLGHLQWIATLTCETDPLEPPTGSIRFWTKAAILHDASDEWKEEIIAQSDEFHSALLRLPGARFKKLKTMALPVPGRPTYSLRLATLIYEMTREAKTQPAEIRTSVASLHSHRDGHNGAALEMAHSQSGRGTDMASDGVTEYSAVAVRHGSAREVTHAVTRVTRS